MTKSPRGLMPQYLEQAHHTGDRRRDRGQHQDDQPDGQKQVSHLR